MTGPYTWETPPDPFGAWRGSDQGDVLSPAVPQPQFAAIVGPVGPQGATGPQGPTGPSVTGLTGHGFYRHGGAAQVLVANTQAYLANDRAVVDETQKPADIATFYDGTRIPGRFGDGLGVEILLTYTPSSSMATWLKLWIEVPTFAPGFVDIFSLPSGSGVARPVSYKFLAYNRAIWTANGARLVVQSDGPGSLTGMNYIFHRLHKGL